MAFLEPYIADKRKRTENGKEICFTTAYEPQKEAQMELIDKHEALKRINSYGGADATDPEDKRCDNLVGYIYADVDSIEPVVSSTDDIAYLVDGTCGECGQEIAVDWDYCPGCGRRLMG